MSRATGATSRRGRDGRTETGFSRTGLVVLAWAALFVNVLAFLPIETVVHVPHAVGQAVAQGCLPIALGIALVVNPRVVVRPNLFLLLLSLMAVLALMVSIHSYFFVGSTFRAVRMVMFVAVLWLLTPWWGRDDLPLLRAHRICLWMVSGSVILGVLIAPGKAFSFEGRLSGVIWPIPPTQVGHYGAVLFGTTSVLWMCRMIGGRAAAITLAVSGAEVVATHTRTALSGLVVGLVVASLSLFLGHARVRRTSALTAVMGVFVVTVFASQLTAWALRGQTSEEAGQFTGRTKVWSAVFAERRPPLENLFGSGMSNQSFNGIPVDSNWVATYLDQGWFGITVEAAFLLVLLLMAITHVRGARRAIALFIVAYAVTASVTETGLSAPSPYLLDLTVAASLLVPFGRRLESGPGSTYAGRLGPRQGRRVVTGGGAR